MSLWERVKLFAVGVGVSTEDAGVFCRTQWKLPWIAWLIYRLLLAIYFVGFMSLLFAYALATEPLLAAYGLIYLTDWTAILVSVYMVVAVVNLFMDRKHGKYYHSIVDRGSLPSIALSRRHKLQWILLNIYINISILVTLVFWIFIRVPLPLVFNLTCHLFPSILGILEVFVTPIPIRLQHVIYTFVYGFIYFVFTVIYFLAGGTDPDGNTGIYPGILDYAHVGPAFLTLFFAGLTVTGSQIFLWVLYKCRKAIVRRTMASSIAVDAPISEAPGYVGIRQDDSSREDVSPQERLNDSRNNSNVEDGTLMLPTISNENQC